jgi:hypothetical protein
VVVVFGGKGGRELWRGRRCLSQHWVGSLGAVLCEVGEGSSEGRGSGERGLTIARRLLEQAANGRFQ